MSYDAGRCVAQWTQSTGVLCQCENCQVQRRIVEATVASFEVVERVSNVINGQRRRNLESYDTHAQENRHDLQVRYDPVADDSNISSMRHYTSSTAHGVNAHVASSSQAIEGRVPVHVAVSSESFGYPGMAPDAMMTVSPMDAISPSDGSTASSSSFSSFCEVIVPPAVLIQCPCCPFNNTRPRFLLEPKEALPLGLKEHILQQHGFSLPDHPQAEVTWSGMYPGCPFPLCTEAPRYPWLHIRNKHLGVKLDWRCRCQPEKTYASRASLCNHMARARRTASE